MADFETVTVNTDLLILGGGMAACGAAVEAAYWAKKNNLKVTLVDKAAMYRSGAVAMGLPIWKDEKGAYVHEGRWQLMINGESYKVVIAEAAKNALEQNGHEFFERIFITHPLIEGGPCVGGVGFSGRGE